MEMKSSWIRLVNMKKAPPASGLHMFKLMARDIHVGHRIALSEPRGVRHHTPLHDMQPLDPWTLGPLNSWTQDDRPFPFLRRSAERDPLQRAMCVALMGHYHCGSLRRKHCCNSRRRRDPHPRASQPRSSTPLWSIRLPPPWGSSPCIGVAGVGYGCDARSLMVAGTPSAPARLTGLHLEPAGRK